MQSDYAVGLELLVRAGLTPMEAIEAATRVAAQAVGLGHVVGTLEPGKEADLIVVEGDPAADIRRLESVVLVVRTGEVVRHTSAAAAAPEVPARLALVER